MRLMARPIRTTEVVAFQGHTEMLIQLRLGHATYLATLDEAVDLARQLIQAVDTAKTKAAELDSEADR